MDEIITSEKKLFQVISQSLSCFSNNKERFMEIKNNLENPYFNKDDITYDPIKFMNEKDLMKKISMNRTNTSNLLKTQQKRLSNPNLEAPIKKSSALLGRMSVMVGVNDECHNYYGAENYSNIYINSRMTNSFKEMTKEQLDEFYSFEDDFV